MKNSLTLDDSDVFDFKKYNMDKFSHLYMSVSLGRKLSSFSMRSLYLQFKIGSFCQPMSSHSVWFNSGVVHFDSTVMIPLSKVKAYFHELDLSIDLYTRQLLSTERLGTAYLPLKKVDLLTKFRQPLLYFYKQSNRPILSENKREIGRIIVTVAIGSEEHKFCIDPPLTFIPTNVIITRGPTEIKKPVEPKEEPPPEKEEQVAVTENNESQTLMDKIEENGWKSRKEIEENWEKYAKENGWVPKNNSLAFESNVDTYTVEPKNVLQGNVITRDVFEFFEGVPEEKEAIHSQISPAQQIITIEPPKSIISPCTTPLKEINSILDDDSDSDVENIINNFIEKKIITELKTQKFTRRENVNRRMARTPSPRKKHDITPIMKSPSIERILEGTDHSLDIVISSDSSDSSDEEPCKIVPILPKRKLRRRKMSAFK